jgi:DNA-binding transcriptional LysR family regulator
MDLARINTNLLVALDLLLTEENVARAAERQNVTASAMSHSLRSLRELFDDPLLVRTRGGMRATAFAETLRGPLRRALRDLERAVSEGARFDASTAERAFIVCAPDFSSTFLLPHVASVLTEQAPKVEVEVRPVRRQGTQLLLRDAAALAEGTIDLVVAAVLGEIRELRTESLYEERFVCIVRKGHPLARRKRLDLETFAAAPQLAVTITDERSPSWVDAELARHGLSRRIALRTRYFMSAPLIVAKSDLVATCPYQLARYFAARLPIVILEPPAGLPKYSEFMAWHERFDADPALTWLRGVFAEAARRAIAEG